MTYEKALEEVICFFEQELYMAVEETTSFNYDLGLTDIDADEALLSFENWFEISIGMIDSDRYYWAPLSFCFFMADPEYYTPEKGLSLTISHLALVVQAGYWFEVPLMYCYPFVELTKPIKNR